MGMLGKPKYTYGDVVEFEIELERGTKTISGTVEIVDSYGTFEQNEEPSYDVMVDDWFGSGQKMFIKHIRESHCKKVQ